MIRYNEAKDQVGMTAWKATTGGKNPIWNQYGHERIQVNQAEMDAWRQTHREYEEKATKIWKDALRDEYDYLDDRIFDVAFSKAWEDGHSGGHDEVANCMIGVVEFVDRILAAK